MKRANLLLTDQSSSGSKMATTGLSTPSGSTRTKAAKGLFSHFMFLASLLLIALLTSGKALADNNYTITPGTNITVKDPDGGTQDKSVKTFTLKAADGFALPANLGTIKMNSVTDLTMADNTTPGNTYQYDPTSGEVTINVAEITGNISFSAAALSMDATLSALQYAFTGISPTDVSQTFNSNTFQYEVALDAYTTAETVTLSGTATAAAAGATISEPQGAAFIPQADGTKKATATIEVTAEDGKTKNTYTVIVTCPKDKLSSITDPTVSAFTVRNADEEAALAALTEQVSTVEATTKSGETVTLDIKWSYIAEKNSSAPYNNAPEASNKFTWTATVPATLDVNSVPLSKEATVANAAASADNTLTALTYKIGTADAVEVTTDLGATSNIAYPVELSVGTAADATIIINATAKDEKAIIKDANGNIGNEFTVQLITGALSPVLTVTAEDGTSRTVTINFTTAAKEQITGVTGISAYTLPKAVATSEDAIKLLEEKMKPVITSNGPSEFKVVWEYKTESNGGNGNEGAFKAESGATNTFDWKIVKVGDEIAEVTGKDVNVKGTITVTNHTSSTDATIQKLFYKIGDGEEKEIQNVQAASSTNDINVPHDTKQVILLVTPTDAFATVAKTVAADQPDLTSLAEVEAQTLTVEITGDVTTYNFTITAEDGATHTDYIVKITRDAEKVTKAEVPATFTLPSAVEGEAAAIALLPKVGNEGVIVSTNGDTEMKLVWEFTATSGNDSYNANGGQVNTFTWTVKTAADGTLESIDEAVPTTGTTVVTNYMPALAEGGENTQVTIDAATPYNKIGNGETPIEVKSITVEKAMDEIVLDKVTVNTELKVEATATGLTLVLKGTNDVKKLTNAGVLTLKQEDVAQSASLLSAISSKAVVTENNGPIKNVDNNGKLTDETATITIVGGDADLTIGTLPTAQSTTGSQATLSVKATNNAGALTYQWQKQSGSNWVSATGTGNKADELTVKKSEDGSGYYRCQVVNTVSTEKVTTLYTSAVKVSFTSNPSTPDEPSNPSTPTYTVSLDKVTGATFSKGETTTVDEGDNFSFKITLDKDYDQSKPVVTVDGTAITADADGNYTIKNIQKDIKIIVSGIVKNTATGIEENVADAARAWTVGSTLYIHVPETSDVYVISGTGALQQQLRGVSGDYNMQLRAGFYIVRIGNVSQKVIIR